MGDEMRREYGDLSSCMLRTVLSRRRKLVCVGLRTVRTWIEKYRRQAPVRGRPAAAPAGVLKRPAAAVLADALEPVRKRAAMTGIDGARALEEACGERYRREVVDLGLGHGSEDMWRRLRVWGYDVSREACSNWLRSYRLSSSFKEGNCAMYALSRQDLRTWYYVDKLTPTQLQDKYRDEHGVFANRSRLITWRDAGNRGRTMRGEWGLESANVRIVVRGIGVGPSKCTHCGAGHRAGISKCKHCGAGNGAGTSKCTFCGAGNRGRSPRQTTQPEPRSPRHRLHT